jgi:hypothetical protein
MDHEAYVQPRPAVMLCSCGAEVDVCNLCGRVLHVTDLEGSRERSTRCIRRGTDGYCVHAGVVLVGTRSALADKQQARRRAKRRGRSV